ncbi:MAG: sigma-70 family RNA polymerase sigma factor [Elusimicrobia bacterium]|nr:sigma-70 family RNA polymerase sigma factor [Elusimicrobiota bacterium]
MRAMQKADYDSMAAYLGEAAKVPLLEPGQEAVLGRELRECHRALELLLLGSRLLWRQVLAWQGQVRGGEMEVAELMPRGRKTPAQLKAMRRRLDSAARLIRRALGRGGPSRETLVARLDELRLNPKKLAALAEKVRLSAARLGALRSELAGYDQRYGGDYARLERYLARRRAGRLKASELRELAGAPEAVVARDLARVGLLRAQLRALQREAPGDPGELLELAELVARAQARITRARTALVEANILLAVSVAKRYSHSRMELADLVQEGTLGLMKAADRFDERRGFKFSTYATWWVRQSIQRAITDKAAVIRLPAHVHGLRERVRLLERRLRELHGREPSVDELASRLHMPPGRLRGFLETSSEPLSLTGEGGDEDDSPLGERLADPREASPLAEARKVLRADEVDAALDTLSAREALVLRLRYGIGTDLPQTLEQCGRTLGLTRERVRQIEAQGLKKLKAPALSSRLRDYWGPGQ